MTDAWHIFLVDEPIRCPVVTTNGPCKRAQDVVLPATSVRVRVMRDGDATQPGSILRECRKCGASLEVNVAPTVGVK